MSVLKNDFFFSEFSELFVHYISIVIPQETETIFPFFFCVVQCYEIYCSVICECQTVGIELLYRKGYKKY